MHLHTNKNYTLVADSPLLLFMSNQKLTDVLQAQGFTNVQVTGTGSKRTASGHWPHAPKEFEIDKKYQAFIKKIEEV